MKLSEQVLRASIPVFINSFNQFTYLTELVNNLIEHRFSNIWILDNNTTFPLLLDYYKQIPILYPGVVNVLFYNQNRGPHYFYFSELYKSVCDSIHFYTDPDMYFPEIHPEFVETFIAISNRYRVAKVGAGLMLPSLDDMVDIKRTMPETRGTPVSIREWESRFWANPIEPNVYNAPVDTTFHLFNPQYFLMSQFYSGIRLTGSGFEVKHRPWFKSDICPSDEIAYYLSASSGHGGWVSGTP